MGHSAGGHLTEMMMATDWPARDAALPADMVTSGVPVSPLDKYASAARAVDMYVVPGVDHFDELNVLVDPASPFFAKTCAMLGL